MKIIPASDSSLMVMFGDAISPQTSERVLGLFQALQARKDTRIRNLHPGYTSLLVDFDPLAVSHEEVAVMAGSLARGGTFAPENLSEVVELPVCYDAEFGPDLADVAAHTGVSTEEVIRLHSGATYRVCFLGFTAGFAYLGGMPEVLQMPRLATPRRTVAPGSVGIAGQQTGIYPAETPGGWRLIGRTPLRMFDPQSSQPVRLQAGDRVRFVAIDRATYEHMRQEPAR
ncbi:MAG: 5-oxoprolinase subunit PxpB [Candidatus Korobacteraceae bacterium]